jgi:hypothetical protein
VIGELNRTALSSVATSLWNTAHAAPVWGNRTDVSDKGKYLVVWRRQTDGRWLIHADAAYSDCPRREIGDIQDRVRKTKTPQTH